MSHTMAVILLESPLNLFTVRRVCAYLQDEGVQKFNDGFYHATISQKDALALLGGFSEHDAADAGFEIVNDNPIRFIFARLRWEVTTSSKAEVAIFGPKSDPAETKVFDQERQATDGVNNPRPKVSPQTGA